MFKLHLGQFLFFCKNNDNNDPLNVKNNFRQFMTQYMWYFIYYLLEVPTAKCRGQYLNYGWSSNYKLTLAFGQMQSSVSQYFINCF